MGENVSRWRTLGRSTRGAGWIAHPVALAGIFFVVALVVMAFVVPIAVFASLAVIAILLGALLLGGGIGIRHWVPALAGVAFIAVGAALLVVGIHGF